MAFVYKPCLPVLCSQTGRAGQGSLRSRCDDNIGRRVWDGGAVTSSSKVKAIDAQATCSSEVVGEPNLPCNSCKGKGWLVCDFCEGQKLNVQARNNRIYRRCPSCRAAGVVICPLCKVFKCVTYPDDKDGVVSL